MNIFSFTAHFGSDEDCKKHFKEQRDKMGVICKNAVEHLIIGSKIKNVMNVKIVDIELLYERALLWKVQNFSF